MSLNAKTYKSESKFKTPEPLDPGTYPARLVRILAMGLQKQNPYKGEAKDPKDELMVTYELLDEFLEDEEGGEDKTKPRWESESFPMNSLDSDLAKSTKRYLAIDAKMEHDGNWAKLIGAPCMVTIVQKKGKGKNAGRIFNNIASVQSMRPKEADKAGPLVNEGKVFDIDEPDMEVFMSLPTFIQDKMKSNLNFGGSALEKAIEAYQGGSGDKGSQKKEKATEGGAQDAPDTNDDDGDDW